MEYLHSLLSLLNGTHRDESEPTALACFLVVNDLHNRKVELCFRTKSKYMNILILSNCLPIMLMDKNNTDETDLIKHGLLREDEEAV